MLTTFTNPKKTLEPGTHGTISKIAQRASNLLRQCPSKADQIRHGSLKWFHQVSSNLKERLAFSSSPSSALSDSTRPESIVEGKNRAFSSEAYTNGAAGLDNSRPSMESTIHEWKTVGPKSKRRTASLRTLHVADMARHQVRYERSTHQPSNRNNRFFPFEEQHDRTAHTSVTNHDNNQHRNLTHAPSSRHSSLYTARFARKNNSHRNNRKPKATPRKPNNRPTKTKHARPHDVDSISFPELHRLINEVKQDSVCGSHTPANNSSHNARTAYKHASGQVLLSLRRNLRDHCALMRLARKDHRNLMSITLFDNKRKLHRFEDWHGTRAIVLMEWIRVGGSTVVSRV